MTISIQPDMDPSEITISGDDNKSIVVAFGPHKTSVDVSANCQSEVIVQSEPKAAIVISSLIPAISNAIVETGPEFSYTDGLLTQITYDSGNTKDFSYTSGKLTQIDYTIGSSVKRKTFLYNLDGTLSEIVETVV